MVEANEEGKQVEQEYGYHSYIQPGEYIAKLEGRTWYGKHNCMGLCCYFHTKEGEQLALYAFRTRWAPYIYTTKNVNMIFIHLEKSKMEAGGDVP